MSVVRLQPVTRTDAEELIAANRASVDLHHPWVHPFTNRRGFDSYFRSLDGERNIGLVARDIADSDIIGVLNLSQVFRKGFQNAYLGFYGVQGQVGHGLMTEAVRLVLGYAFDELGLHRLEANVQPENVRSIALIERVGFRKEGYSPRYLSIEGVWRDHERWAILSEEFAA